MPAKFPEQDEKWMRLALGLAAKALGLTRPNPVVGAVVVKEGAVVAKGHHRAAGKPHAEAVALRRASEAARGASLYVTLEPCCHHGRTPPCTNQIIEAGIKRVVVPIRDPHPAVAGKGIRALREAGIKVDVGCLAHEAAHINQPFLTFHRLGRPFFVAKWAMTLDGQVRAISGDSRWITNEASRRHVHRLRARYDAVMVGIGTVLADNPRLNVRLLGRRKVIQPVRIIVDGYLRTPLKALCIDPTDAGATILAASESASRRRVEEFRQRGVTVLIIPSTKGILDLVELAARLHAMDIQSVLVEGGQLLLSSLFAAGLVDRVVAFFAPKVVGAREVLRPLTDWGVHLMKEALPLHDVEIRHFQKDVCVEGYVRHLGRAPRQETAGSRKRPRR